VVKFTINGIEGREQKLKNNHLIYIIMLTYSTILQGSEANEQNAIDFAQGYDFSEDETSEFNTLNKTYIDTVNGVDIYYDYAADYYFFAENN